MHKRKMSNSELAEKIGCTKTYVGDILNRKKIAMQGLIGWQQ